MFKSLENRQSRNSVVHPVLALVVHAGLISLVVRGGPARPIDPLPRPVIPPWTFVPAIPGSDGSLLPEGTPLDPPVSAPIGMPPDLPTLPTHLVSVPVSRPGTFDPRPYLGVGTVPDPAFPDATILTEGELSDPPRALHLAEPRYPEALRQSGIGGAVTVTYVVDASGFVEPSSVRIVSSDHPAFAAAVLASVGTARFTPGRVQGRAVRVLVRQVIRFAART